VIVKPPVHLLIK